MSDDEFMDAVRAELERDRTKVPDPSFLLRALVEEVGELAEACMHGRNERVVAEAVQVAVMACRVAVQGDPTLDRFRARRGLMPMGGRAREDAA